MAQDWTTEENALIIKDYFDMLDAELRGQPYRKSDHFNALVPLLNRRTKGSIEFKHMNISGILFKQEMPYIAGYKPLLNKQNLLEEMVLQHLEARQELELAFTHFLENAATTPQPKASLFERLEVDAPVPGEWDKVLQKSPPLRRVRKVNFLKLEQENARLGKNGEQLILDYERWRLRGADKANLADQVEWISAEQGDGAGFDILSRNLDGSDRYIEVKTTKLGNLTPFYFSRNELSFSQEHRERYHLYRVFHFASKPAFFRKDGSFEDFCRFEPTQYIGRI